MIVESSFSHLFRQSRFARSFEEGDSVIKQNRRELFAVAAVAFVIKHDAVFANDFLVRVAGVPMADLHHNFKILPQAADCADLLIEDLRNDRRYIVEFKVHAQIEDKQSPAKTAFKDATGYGSQIIRRYGKNTETYTILSKHRDLDDKVVRGIRCRERTWKELTPLGRNERPLVKDLLDSLGDFGIPVLRLRHVYDMRNANHVLGAINIHDLLDAILDRFRSSPLDVGADENYRWCGRPLAARKGEHQALRGWLGHGWRGFGWIGYLLRKDNGKPELSVWLYFGPHRHQHRDASIRVLKRRLPGKTVRASEKGLDLIVSEPAERIKDDKQWFTEVLKVVLTEARPVKPKTKR